MRLRRGWVFGAIIVVALISFEIFNYSTTEYALSDLLGDLKFAGIRWATILSIAFCGIDFAGIARLFTPSNGSSRGSAVPNETWYLFGAWLLAATMNAMLTWWGVSLAVVNHQSLGNSVVSREILVRAVPIFVALLVWLIRVLIIGTFSVAGDRIFRQDELRSTLPAHNRPRPNSLQPTFQSFNPRSQHSRTIANPSATPTQNMKNATPYQPEFAHTSRPEPTYHPLSTSASSSNSNNTKGAPIADPARGGSNFRH